MSNDLVITIAVMQLANISVAFVFWATMIFAKIQETKRNHTSIVSEMISVLMSAGSVTMVYALLKSTFSRILGDGASLTSGLNQMLSAYQGGAIPSGEYAQILVLEVVVVKIIAIILPLFAIGYIISSIYKSFAEANKEHKSYASILLSSLLTTVGGMLVYYIYILFVGIAFCNDLTSSQITWFGQVIKQTFTNLVVI